ncbi:MAG TPA: hypothetical protein VEZ90_11270 [Blastocatellia bacterium]|nr:hypothetical protein [Blastocatellia bacterium]
MTHPAAQLSDWPRITEGIKEISFDNRSGAAEILKHSVELFSLAQDECAGNPAIDAEQAMAIVNAICSELSSAQGDMAPLLNMVRRLRSEVSLPADSGQAVFHQAARSATDFAASAGQWAQQAAWHMAGLIAQDSTLLTHSRSSTVLLALKRAKESGKSFSVIVTESRPLMEGRLVAKSLAGDGIPVTLIADAAAALAIQKADMVVIGADRVSETHLVNKIGSYMIALAARERGIPFYSIADSSKFISDTYIAERSEAHRSSGELCPIKPAGVTVFNRYFEQVPLEVVTGFVTQGGLHPTAAVPLLLSSTASSSV